MTARGWTVRKIGRTMAAVMVDAPVRDLLNLGDPRIELAMSMDGQPSEHRCNGGTDKTTEDCAVDPNVWANIDDVFNSQDIYGAGQRVAIYEDTGSQGLSPPVECGLYESHESFKFISGINYSYNSSPTCVNPHATAVASVILGAMDNMACGASEVELYYPNEGVSATFVDEAYNPMSVRTSICRADATLAAYEWMSGVSDPPLSAINESFGCVHENINCNYGNAAEWDGVTQDYHARMYDLVVVKAAGNRNCAGLSGGLTHGLHHEACPFTLNSICVGSVSRSGNMSCFSSSVNPGGDPGNSGPDQPDREEPDLVTLGGNGSGTCSEEGVCVANTPGGDQAWKGWYGTSFAAPLVTSMITLFREQCETTTSGRFSQTLLRALMRSAAFAGNPIDTRYSTPTPVAPNYHDGAGMLKADQLAGCPTGTDLLIDLDDGDPMPEGRSPYQDNWTSPGAQSITPSSQLKPAAFNYEPGPSSNRESAELLSVSLGVGDRIRATFSWNGCALDATGTAPGSVAVDFDLFLYYAKPGSEKYVWASQSLDDNNEGFDYEVQAGEAGTYKLYLAWPEGSTSCEGTNVEPAALAVITF